MDLTNLTLESDRHFDPDRSAFDTGQPLFAWNHPWFPD